MPWSMTGAPSPTTIMGPRAGSTPVRAPALQGAAHRADGLAGRAGRSACVSGDSQRQQRHAWYHHSDISLRGVAGASTDDAAPVGASALTPAVGASASPSCRQGQRLATRRAAWSTTFVTPSLMTSTLWPRNPESWIGSMPRHCLRSFARRPNRPAHASSWSACCPGGS